MNINRGVQYRGQFAGGSCYALAQRATAERDKELFAELSYGVEALRAFQELIDAPTEEYLHVTINKQPIFVDRDFGEKFLDGYGQMSSDMLEPKTYGSVQVGRPALQKFNVQAEEGRIFEPADYSYQGGEEIPVILGSEYKQFYQTGDRTPISYLSKEFTACVVGILPAQTILPAYGMELNLDRTFVLPSLEVANAEIAPEFQAMLYGQKNSGAFYTRLSMLEMQKKVDSMLEEAGLKSGDYIFEGMSDIKIDSMGMGVAQTRQALSTSIFLLFALAVFLMMLCVYLKVSGMTRTLAVHMVCGSGRMRIAAAVVLEVLLWVAVGFLISSAVSVFLFRLRDHLGQMVLLSLLTALIAPIPALIRIATLNIPENIRRSR